MIRLTPEQWAERERQTGKSQAIMQALEEVVAEYGGEALALWHYKAGLLPKPRIRVKAGRAA